MSKIESRIRTSGSLVLLGLLVEAISLLWSHPTAFLLFAFLGGGLIAFGMMMYLYSLVSLPAASEEATRPRYP
jgi:hypothetical protein